MQSEQVERIASAVVVEHFESGKRLVVIQVDALSRDEEGQRIHVGQWKGSVPLEHLRFENLSEDPDARADTAEPPADERPG